MEESTEFAEAIRFCAGFERCMNYPKDVDGVKALAVGLLKASERSGIPMRAIVESCLETSMYCPTDADFITVAHGLKGPVSTAETIPEIPREEVRKNWQAFAHQFPEIMENGLKWEQAHAAVCAKIRNKMGMDRWMLSTGEERVRVGIEMGLPILHQPKDMRDCGTGIFVAKRGLSPAPGGSWHDGKARAGGGE